MKFMIKGYEDGYDAAVLDELEEAQTLALSYYMRNKQALDKILKWRDVMKELTETYEDFKDLWIQKYETDFSTRFWYENMLIELHQRFEMDKKIKELGDRLAEDSQSKSRMQNLWSYISLASHIPQFQG
jgi:hypothetical protein